MSLSLVDTVRRKLAELNEDLRRRGDSARVRYVAIEPDPAFEGEWLALATWELPDPPTADDWPLEQLDNYCELLAAQLEDIVASTECLFRTPNELTEDAKLGDPVPEPV